MAPCRAEGWVTSGIEGLDSSRDTEGRVDRRDGAAGEGSATAAEEERNGEFLGYMKKCQARRCAHLATKTVYRLDTRRTRY
ncbi:hypothetical protein C2S51_024071 [Perilla frutescens var. frutescens]|nr:hypothetical protein C2S51_024071 [Perilla frutescens var. frutescens]